MRWRCLLVPLLAAVLSLAAGCAVRGDDRFVRLPDGRLADARLIRSDARGPDAREVADAALADAAPDALPAP